MSVNLTKGQPIDLSKVPGGDTLSRVDVTLSWKENTTSGADFDPDVVAFVRGDDDKVLGEPWAIFFGNKTTPGNEVVHSGDDRTGGTGETISVDLTKLPALAESVMFAVTIYHAKVRQQNFGAIDGLTIRLDNADTHDEIAKGDLSFEDATYTAINFAKLERHDGAWAFRPIGQGYNDGLKKLFEDNGLQVGGDEYDEGND